MVAVVIHQLKHGLSVSGVCEWCREYIWMIWELMSENLQVFSLSVKEAEVSQGKFGSG